jgi:glucose/arabinose dehydrogenase
MRLRLTVTAALIVGAGTLAACSGAESPPVSGKESPAATTPGPTASSPASSRPVRGGTPVVAGVIARNLEVPWGLAFLPGGEALVAERDTARIKRVTPGGQVSVVGTVPGVDPGGEGGLMGLAVARTFPTDHQLYVYFTAADDNRIVRITYEGGRLGRLQTLVTGIPKAGNHNGGRLVFGPDGMLYASTGERGDPPLAQDRDSLGGKILRMTPQGRPAPGNPFGGSLVYSYGHRNVQGLAFDSAGRLWASEFGAQTWDELNLVKPGRNYGWPIAEGRGGAPEYVDPLAQWGTDEASPSGLAIVGDVAYMAGLRGARLWRIPLNGESVGEPKAYFTGEYGRLRTVEVGPDGGLWLATNNTDGRGRDPFPRQDDDKILRIALR